MHGCIFYYRSLQNLLESYLGMRTAQLEGGGGPFWTFSCASAWLNICWRFNSILCEPLALQKRVNCQKKTGQGSSTMPNVALLMYGTKSCAECTDFIFYCTFYSPYCDDHSRPTDNYTTCKKPCRHLGFLIHVTKKYDMETSPSVRWQHSFHTQNLLYSKSAMESVSF